MVTGITGVAFSLATLTQERNQMENWMDQCFSVASILRWLAQNIQMIVCVYALCAWIYGARIMRKWAAGRYTLDSEEVATVSLLVIIAPLWTPMYVLWYVCDLGGRRLRAKQEADKARYE